MKQKALKITQNTLFVYKTIKPSKNKSQKETDVTTTNTTNTTTSLGC